MLNALYVDEHLNRLGLGDYEISESKEDPSGDFVKSFLPDLDYDLIKSKIHEAKYYNQFIDDVGPMRIEMTLSDEFDGTKALYKLIIERGQAFGTVISMVSKRVDYYDEKGNYLPLIGFGMLKSIQPENNV